MRPKTKKNNCYRGFMPAAIALALCGAVLALIYMLPGPKNISPAARPPFEDFSMPVPGRSAALPSVHTSEQPAGISRPLVAIIIDDMGYDYSMDEAFLRLNAPLSYAFLPFAPNTEKLAGQAAADGKDVLVHIPMEPLNRSIDPGPGVLRLDMDFNTTIKTLKRDLDAVPGAIGANNHMGSGYTEDKKAMEIVLNEIRRRRMFFVDSRTSADTVAYRTARRMGIPAGWRSVFLDHTPAKKAVKHELYRLVNLARQNGRAIAIGHPVKVTLQVLYRELPGIQKKVRLVPIHILLDGTY